MSESLTVAQQLQQNEQITRLSTAAGINLSAYEKINVFLLRVYYYLQFILNTLIFFSYLKEVELDWLGDLNDGKKMRNTNLDDRLLTTSQ